jgi:DNA-binding NarL/FixJ family response regulator
MIKGLEDVKLIKILLTEDHNIVRNGIRSLLEKVPDFEVVGEASNGVEALDVLAGGKNIDVALVDMNMPQMSGIELIEKLKKSNPEIKVVVLSMLDHEKYVYQAFVAGARGYLLKSVSADEMVFAIKHIAAGGKYLCSELSFTLLDRLIYAPEVVGVDDLDLSKREIEVLDLIAEGLTNIEISEKLFTSKRTVEGHRLSLMNKTNSKNSSALIKFAVLNGLIN